MLTPYQIVNILLESPPNVEPLLGQIVAELKKIYKGPVTTKKGYLEHAINTHPFLSRYIYCAQTGSHATGSYNPRIKKITLNTGDQSVWHLDTVTAVLRHELAHMEQDRLSGGKFHKTAAARKASTRYMNMFDPKTRIMKPQYSHYDYRDATAAKYRMYAEDPIEVQAFGVETAGELGHDWQNKLRSGAKDLPGTSFYAVPGTVSDKTRKRFYKTAYQSAEQMYGNG